LKHKIKAKPENSMVNVDMDLTVEELEEMLDFADKETLSRYDDGRLWLYLKDDTISLGLIAYAVIKGQYLFLNQLYKDGKIVIADSIKDIPGEDFLCIYSPKIYYIRSFE
jgi:hypothetical protein